MIEINAFFVLFGLFFWPRATLVIVLFMSGHPFAGLLGIVLAVLLMGTSSTETVKERVKVVEKVVMRSALTRDEAWAVLGLTPGAPRERIAAAYKAMMSRVHPDHGGSTYLAQKVNEARTLLVGR